MGIPSDTDEDNQEEELNAESGFGNVLGEQLEIPEWSGALAGQTCGLCRVRLGWVRCCCPGRLPRGLQCGSGSGPRSAWTGGEQPCGSSSGERRWVSGSGR